MNLVRELYGSAVEHLVSIDECIRQIGVGEADHDHFLDIYVPQRFAWDCGLACCSMVTQWKKGRSEDVYDHPLASLSSPLWTIDLLILLRDLGVAAEMRTVCAGMQDHHTTYEWYNHGASNDSARILQQFALARSRSFAVLEKSEPINFLQDLFLNRRDVVVVLLVDNLTLARKPETGQYRGHFILLVGYSQFADSFSYLDPSRIGVHSADSSILDDARKHPGTDEDMIVCYS